MSAKHAPQSADPTFAFHQIEPGTLVSTSPPAASAAAGTVHAPPILLRLPMVMRITGLARSTIYKLIAQNQFPAPIKLSKRAVAWLQSEIESWVSSRVRAL